MLSISNSAELFSNKPPDNKMSKKKGFARRGNLGNKVSHFYFVCNFSKIFAQVYFLNIFTAEVETDKLQRGLIKATWNLKHVKEGNKGKNTQKECLMAF